MTTDGLTKSQARVLAFIEESLRNHGLSPTVREIANAIGARGTSGTHCILMALRDRGRIQWKPRLPRSIVLIPEGRAHHTLPPDLQVKLEAYCNAHNERPGDVLADALALHFDALESCGAETAVAP